MITNTEKYSFPQMEEEYGDWNTRDGLQTLIDDHNAVRELFANYAEADNVTDKELYKNQIIKFLSVHDVIERLHLYPLAEELWGADYALVYRMEHEELAQLLYLIDHLDVAHPAHDKLIMNVFDKLTVHIDEEERELFPALREELTPDELYELGLIIDEAREEAPTHPHPGSPDQPMRLKQYDRRVMKSDQALDQLRIFPQ